MISFRNADIFDRFKSQPRILANPVYCEIKIEKIYASHGTIWEVLKSPSFAGTKRSIEDIKVVLIESGFTSDGETFAYDMTGHETDDEIFEMLKAQMEMRGMVIDEAFRRDDTINITYATEAE